MLKIWTEQTIYVSDNFYCRRYMTLMTFSILFIMYKQLKRMKKRRDSNIPRISNLHYYLIYVHVRCLCGRNHLKFHKNAFLDRKKKNVKTRRKQGHPSRRTEKPRWFVRRICILITLNNSLHNLNLANLPKLHSVLRVSIPPFRSLFRIHGGQFD